MEWQPVSKSYLHSLAFADKVHKVNKPDFCAICSQTGKRKMSIEQIHVHQSIAKEQSAVFMNQIKTLQPEDIIVVQDFTQIELSPNGSLQDFILVLYRRTKPGGSLERLYYHYVGGDHQKNDFHFVKGCWLDLMDRLTLYANSNIQIWSDGGRKHFKQTGQIRFWSELQDDLRKSNITIQYNFYASYHGHNACDAVASHAKSAIKKYQLNFAIPVNNQSDVVGVLANMPSSIVMKAICGLGKPPKVPTFKGISRYHCFRFPAHGKIIAHRTSLTSVQSHLFTVKQK